MYDEWNEEAVISTEDDNPYEEDDLDAEDELNLINLFNEFNNEATQLEEAMKDIEDWTDFPLKRNACLPHLLQLAIKDAINSSCKVASVIKHVNDIVSFFSKSHKSYNILRKKISGLSLVKPCTTRWNSVYHSLKRIVDPKR